MTLRPRALLGAAALAVGVGLAVPADAQVPTASYVVTTVPGSNAQALVKALGGRVGFVYSHALNGFSVTLPVPALSALQLLPGVVAVQPDLPVHASGTQAGPPSYGLDRIDQRALPLNNSYSYTADGTGVTAYVIDTGINYGHSDFGGRARAGFDAVTAGGGAVDCNGHGTHVSGTIGGTAYGVAKRVSLVGVRVLDCDGSGTTAQVVAGIDWVKNHHQAGVPAVANMSLGGGVDNAIDTAVNNAIADGITFGVAAGNDGGFVGDLLGSSNACNHSPARVAAALTVGATDKTDTKASYSNKGTCLDLFAPGTDIKSAWMGSSTATNTISGTSMATPHVVGVAALYLAGHTSATPAAVASALLGSTTNGVVKSPGTGSPNRLLFEAW
ncbi:MAG TPA: S8 family serine peptidase [Mycobacteriales bacterium]|nr:S8 family serine peptidase [Mycobacteriales bacterium]